MQKFTNLLLFAFVVVINSVLLFYFYNRFWWAPDEGLLAHIAERYVQGEILSLEVHQFLTGYLHFVNAFFLSVFGKSLLSLRYPLIAISFIQALLVFFVMRPTGYLAATVASLIPAALGVLQYLNPNQHWYCLFFMFVLVCYLTWQRENNSSRFFVVGLLVALIYLFRQLSGVLAGIGALSFLLMENQESHPLRDRFGVRIFIGFMLAGLTLYEINATNLFGFLFIGAWPILILLWLTLTVNVSLKKFKDILANFVYGAITAFIPLIVYHYLNGSLSAWYDDTIIRMIHYTDQPYMKLAHYASILSMVKQNLIFSLNFSEVVNAVFWFVIIFIYFFCGYSTILMLIKFQKLEQGAVMAIPFLAAFYAVVSLHYQIPIYLFHTFPLSLIGLLWLFHVRYGKIQLPVTLFCLFLCVIGLIYHAGQPLSRGMKGIVQGQRIDVHGGPKKLRYVDLLIEEQDNRVYSHVIALIQKEVMPNETIFAMPYNPEFYFLSDRRNAFPFAIFEHGVKSPEDYEGVMSVFTNRPPKLVINNPLDKRQTFYSRQLINGHIKEHYQLIAQISCWDIYKLIGNVSGQ